LNYHRIDDASRLGFDTFAQNFSATPDEFALQMDYVQRHFNVISCEHLRAWIDNEIELPPRPALITFDDGYYDNYAYAYPILKARNLRAVIFLTTGLIEQARPFYWDHIAYCFQHTKRTSAILPHLGTVSWNTEIEKKKVIQNWVDRLKQLPDQEKQQAVDNLPELLDASISDRNFSGLYLTWDQIREMSQNGIEMGSHTVNHPILTRIPLSEVETELIQSRQKIETEIKKPVIAFAYPNGGQSDFSPDVISAVRRTGYQLAFTLTREPCYYSRVRANPFAIPRVYLGSSDVLARFVAKLSLGPRVKFHS
jgi:peptidoglycan/xylan/chitin deacetylase (PgdA/CDA1 family)